MSNKNEAGSEAFNIKEFILTALSYKYFYIISFIVCIGVAFMINKFSPTVYEVNSILGPVEDRQSALLGTSSLSGGYNEYAESRNLENDINSLSSFTLISSTLNKLNLEVGYFAEKENLLSQEEQIYPDAFFKVTIDKSHVQPIDAKFYIDVLDENSFRLTSSEEEVNLYNYIDNNIVSEKNVLNIDTVCRFNSTISNKNYKFSITLNRNLYLADPKDENRYFFEFYHLDVLTQSFLDNLRIEPVSLRSSLINVFYQGKNRNITIDFLNNYLKTYLENDLSKKTKIASNTVNFIDSQISDISDSLLVSESELRNYRSANQVTDLSYQGQQALGQLSQIEAEKSALQVQKYYYNYILDYFNKNQDIASLAPPSSANVSDPIMNTLILDLLALSAERSTILSNNAEKNLFLGQIENKIKLQKQSIIDNVTNNLNTLNLSENELDYRTEKLNNEISRLPRTELNMVNMERKFNLTDATYTFLLQKRSESAITMASSIPDYEILEPARAISSEIISPKQMFNWMIACFLALMIPTAYIVLRSFFNEKVTRIYDVEQLLNRPVLSVIYSSIYKTEEVVRNYPGSSIAESFRNLRSSLFLRFKSKPLKIITISSSQPQDGKSFIAFNLASSIASVGYKTIILDCDLRRPTLHEKFKQDNSIGLSTYMIHKSKEDEIIQKTSVEHLSFIPAGPILPNSAELIESGILDKLVESLKSQFDYIIIDTTPAGLVADASLMMKYADLNLLVCRNNYTRKDVFKDVLNMLSTNRIENFDVIFNDLNLKESRYGRFTNYYQKD